MSLLSMTWRPFAHRPRRGGPRPPDFRPRLEELESRNLLSGFWTALANSAPSSTGTMMLLTDGTVMAEAGGQTTQWSRLTPDSSGSYVNGTWSSQASMNASRLYFGSNILTDGRAFVIGGEYSSDGSWTRTAEIYDPQADTWTRIASFPQSQYGDDPSAILPDGRILLGYLSGPQTYIYDPATDSYSQTGTKLRSDSSDEESWVQLPDRSILSYDVFHEPHSQRYLPDTGQWVDAGNVPVNLSGGGPYGYELGPAFMLPDGRAIFFGANGHSAYYDPTANSWTAGPDIPAGLGADDAPGAMMPNGHILLAADTPLFHGPTSVFEFDPTANGGFGSYTDVTPSGYSLGDPAYVSRMLMLPSGEVLFTNGSGSLMTYTPNESPDPSWQPTVSGVNDNGDGTFTVSGTLLSGISEGASYGDDAEMSSNYPLVQLTDPSGNVSYARTTNWSNTGVSSPGDATPQTVLFTPPAGLSANDYSLVVIANGIPSVAVDFPYGIGGVAGGVAPQLTLGNGTTHTPAHPGEFISAANASAPVAVLASGQTNAMAGGVTAALGSDLALTAVIPPPANVGPWAVPVIVTEAGTGGEASGWQTQALGFQRRVDPLATTLGGSSGTLGSPGEAQPSDQSALTGWTQALDPAFHEGLFGSLTAWFKPG